MGDLCADRGRVGIVDADTGDVALEMVVQLGGVSTVLLSMCARGDRIAFGTLDGRLLVLHLQERVARH